jgi:hypothetical protein
MGQWQPCDGYIKENVVILKLELSNIEEVVRKIFRKNRFFYRFNKSYALHSWRSFGLRHIAQKAARRRIRKTLCVIILN